MELKEFIKQTLLDIAGVIQETNEDITTNIVVNPKDVSGSTKESLQAYLSNEEGETEDIRPIQKIKFDVAVTTGGEIQGGAAAGINVAGIKLGGSGELTDKHQNESRIQFEIPVALPNGEYKK
jgi:hypothetical protein